MSEGALYAVFLFSKALEELGDPVKPYIVQGAGGPHLLCAEIDASGSLFQMTIPGKKRDGTVIEIELMLPHAMVKLVMSLHGEHEFGFLPATSL